jgi:tight adherence protein C
MALISAVALLGCYLALVRGLLMARVGPRYMLDEELVKDPSAQRRSLVVEFYGRLGRRTGPGLAGLLGPRWRVWTARQLASAGQPCGYDVTGFAEFQGAYVTLGVVTGLFLLPSGLPLLGMLIGALLVFYPTVWLWSEARRRQGLIERELPDFLDILAVTVSAGLGFRQALERVGETLAGPLAEEVRRILRRMDVGVRRRQAFVELRDRNPRSATMGLFVTAILQAEELGAPLVNTLNQLARDMRREFSQQARRRAARAAPRVSLIITMVIMPGIVALIVTAVFLSHDLHWPGR